MTQMWRWACRYAERYGNLSFRYAPDEFRSGDGDAADAGGGGGGGCGAEVRTTLERRCCMRKVQLPGSVDRVYGGGAAMQPLNSRSSPGAPPGHRRGECWSIPASELPVAVARLHPPRG